MYRSGSKYALTLTAAAMALGGSAMETASRAFRWPKPEKYPGQRRAYLIGANCPEGERMRAEKGERKW